MEPPVGIFSLADLLAQGHTRHSITMAIESSRIERLRRGWYAAPGADPEARLAVEVGGILTASSASAHYGMWTPATRKLHVLVARNAGRLRPLPNAGENQELCLHWAKGAVHANAVASPLQIVTDAAHCLPFEEAVTIADSALNKKLITLAALSLVVPAIAQWCDPGSQSGTESLTRVRLRRRKIHARSQVWIDRVGLVDLLVGDRLVIECDSAAFHDGYQSTRDYDRDLELIASGYIVLRLRYRHVIFEWDRVEGIVMSIVRARRHLWRRGAGSGTGRVISL